MLTIMIDLEYANLPQDYVSQRLAVLSRQYLDAYSDLTLMPVSFLAE